MLTLQDAFLPTTLDGWVGFVMKAIGLITVVGGATWRLGIAPLRRELDGLGGRVNKWEAVCGQHGERFAHIDREHDLNEFRRERDAEILVQMQGTLRKIEEYQTRQTEAGVRDDKDVATRLASLEAEVRGLSNIVRTLTNRAFPAERGQAERP